MILDPKNRQFKPGDEVLVLPGTIKKFCMSCSGLYKVLKKYNKVDYFVGDPKEPNLYCVNILKRYFRRATVNVAHVLNEVSVSKEETCLSGLVEMKNEDDFVSCPTLFPNKNSIPSACMNVDLSLGWDRCTSLGN